MSGIENGWGLDVILWFQSWRTPLIQAIAMIFHVAGSEDFYLIAVTAIYWCVDAALGRRLALLFVANAWLNSAFKELFQRPRPYTVSDKVIKIVVEDSPGLPSGHAQNAVAFWGAVALKVRRNWVTALVVAYALLTAISRMVLGVHFPQDVIGGLMIGLIVLGLYAWLEPKISAWLNRQRLWTHIGLATGTGGLIMIIHPFLIPASQPDSLSASISAAAVLIGAGIGFALETRFVRFDEKGVWWKRLLRFALGIALALAVRFGLSAIFASLEPVWVFRLIRYVVIGLTISAAAPWVFVQIKLADRKQ